MSSPERHLKSGNRASLAKDPGFVLTVRLYRRFIPLPIAVVLLLIFQPRFSGNPSVDTLMSGIGFLLCATGQSLRLWAWGSNTLKGESEVRDRGAYALMRHPLYAGNFLIAMGLAVTYTNPIAYFVLVAPLAFIYNVSVRAEEKAMMEKFASDYQRYRASCRPRFLPAPGRLGAAARTTFPFGWGFAWRKEYPSFCAWLAGLAGLELYKEVLAYGWARPWYRTWLWLAVMGICGTAMILSTLRKQR